MRFIDLRNAVLDNLEAGISTHLKSAPGRGKSEFVEDLVKFLSKRDGFEWGFTTCFLATYTPSDLLGYMVPTKVTNPDGTGSLASVFTTPPWMMTKPTKEYRTVDILTLTSGALSFWTSSGRPTATPRRAQRS